MGEAALCFMLKDWRCGGCQVGFHDTQCELCKWCPRWASEGRLRERGGSAGTCGETTCCRQGLVMSFKLTLHGHGNLIYYPLTCCHSACSFRYSFIRSFNQDGLSSKCVLGPEVKVGTRGNGNPILPPETPVGKVCQLLKKEFLEQDNDGYPKVIPW